MQGVKFFMVDRVKIEAAVRLFLESIGEDLNREGLQQTPSRVANMCVEIFGNRKKTDEACLFKSFSSGFGGLVVVKDIAFCSFCEHHLMPFFGKVHVAYLADDRVIGLSKIGRIVDLFSGRLQLQENLTEMIVTSILDNFNVKGVMVVVDGLHTCMTLRGVKKFDSRTLTFSSGGICKSDEKLKDYFLKLVGLI